MATVAKHKTVGTVFSNEMVTERVVYDFAVDAGATGALDLFTAGADIILMGFYAYVKTAATSGGSATLKVGVTGDDDLFMTTTEGAVANLSIGTVHQAKPVLTEGTPNTVVWPFPRKLASGDKILQTIGTATFLTGKIEYVLQYVKA